MVRNRRRPGQQRGAEALTVAAVDLGSNSFHLIIARLLDHEIQIVDRMREQVMLADGLDGRNVLSEEAQQRALACLERIGQRLRSLPSVRVRAVGTNTLRKAKNATAFRQRAQKTLGHPIEIISGQEEARLIHLGVTHDQYSDATRLLVDIGGGSTEILLGQGYEVLRAHSLFMGCVNYSMRFFPEGTIRKECFREAEIAAGLELRTIRRELKDIGWDGCLGSSGTITAVVEILRTAGWSEGPVTWAGIKKLRRAMIEAGSVERFRFDGLRSERARVLPGGLAILRAVFRALEIDAMIVSSGALREGVLHDLVGRIRRDDIRDHTIQRMMERYHADQRQATRVEQDALRLMTQVADWQLDSEPMRKLLAWSARLHEIGLAVAYTGFHKHGAYLIEHSHMPGFSADDQSMLAAIVRGQRRKVSRALFSHLPSDSAEPALRLCVLLRLAILLNRGRSHQTTPEARLSEGGSRLELCFPPAWSEAHPLTRADLEQEAGYLRAVGIDLGVLELETEASAKQPKRGMGSEVGR